MIQWILIFYLNFTQPLAPAVITGFPSEKDCQETADRLHQGHQQERLAPSIVSVCLPAKLINKE